MPKRPTIADLAQAADVSISTVDRVINGRNPVRKQLAEKVLAAAGLIGYHGVGAIRHQLGEGRPRKILGFLLLQKSRSFYQLLGDALAEATRASPLIQGTPKIVHLDDFDPAAIAAQIGRLGGSVDAIAIVAANHPYISNAIDALAERDVTVFSLISELTAKVPPGYAGLDNFKVGRTAAWAIANICKAPGKVGIIVGSHRFRCQDINEMGFRSYFREHAPDFTLLEPLTSLEDARYAAEITRDLLARVPELAGLYVAGGGMSGVLAALRERGRLGECITIGHDLTAATRCGLIDGTLKLAIAHPVHELARSVVEAMALATTSKAHSPVASRILPFNLYTAENA